MQFFACGFVRKVAELLQIEGASNIICIVRCVIIIVGLCRKRLDSTNATEHNGMLWCKICYSRKFGPKGVGFGCGAGTLNMDKGEVFGNFESSSNKPMDPYYGINSKFFQFK